MFSKEVMLKTHLQYNHYPPVHPSWIPIAETAIDAANNSDWMREIHPEYSVAEILDHLHLNDFIEDNGEYPDA